MCINLLNKPKKVRGLEIHYNVNVVRYSDVHK